MFVTSRFVSRGFQFHPEHPLRARLRALAQLSCRQLRRSLDRCNIHIHKHIYTILLFVSLADALISCESSSDEDWKRSLSLLLHRSQRRRDVARRKPERETGRKSDDFLPHTLLQGKLRCQILEPVVGVGMMRDGNTDKFELLRSQGLR